MLLPFMMQVNMLGTISNNYIGGSFRARSPWVKAKKSKDKWLERLIKDLEDESSDIEDTYQAEIEVQELDLDTSEIFATLHKIKRIRIRKKQQMEDEELLMFL